MAALKFISLFSGIEAASVAWEPLGWEPIAFSEIEPFPCELLKQRYPNVPNLGDITEIDWSAYRGKVDLIVGGSPCQSFSIAGNREGLKGESGLMFEYIRAVREVMPRYFVWENVPGALSSEKGAAFGQLLHEMDVCGYGLAWRVLDAQFFGVPQRRRRVFLVGCLGNAGHAAQILFEREGVRWDYPSSRDKRESLAAHAKSRIGSCYTMLVRCGCAGGGKGALIQDDVSATLSTSNVQTVFQPIGFINNSPSAGSIGADVEIAPTMRAGDNLASIPSACYCLQGNMIGRGDKNGPQGDGINDDIAYTLNTTDRHAVACPSQVICMADANANAAIDNDLTGTLKVGGEPPIVSFPWNAGGNAAGSAIEDGTSPTIRSTRSGEPAVAIKDDECAFIVRKLMPIECERLQGFPDGWTDIEFKGKPASDAVRYKALGNSMAVPVMRWIGERINQFDMPTGGDGNE